MPVTGSPISSWSDMYKITGPIIDVSAQTGDGDLSVSASDRAETVIASRFTSPRSAPSQEPLVSTVARDLLDDVWGIGCLGAFDETYTKVPKMTWDSERGGALNTMMSAASSNWYANADGTFTYTPAAN